MNTDKKEVEVINKKLYPIYKIKLVNYLVRCGHVIEYITDDERDPSGRYKCIWFTETDKLKEDLSEYTKVNNIRKRGNK